MQQSTSKQQRRRPNMSFSNPLNATFTLYNLIGNIQFRYVHDPTLLEIGEEAKMIKDSDEIIINADKTGNKYGTSVADYKQLLHENLTRDYKLDKNNNLSIVNEDTHKYAKLMSIADGMERHSETNAFLTVKDHKQGFPRRPP